MVYRSAWRFGALAALALVQATSWAQSQGTTAAGALSPTSMPRGFAAASFQSPVAFGGGWGAVGFGVVQVRGTHDDGSAALSFGLGDPDTSVGLDVAAVISSLSRSKGGEYGFGEEGGLTFKLHRNIGDYTAIALGTGPQFRWGGDVYMDRNPPGVYAVATRGVFVGDSLLMLSAGLGRHVTHKSSHQVDPLGSAALYLRPWLSVIGEYNGYTANAGVSVAPFPDWLPLTFTAGAVDLAKRHNENVRFVMALSLGYHF